MSIRVRQLSGLLFIYTTGSVHRFKWSNRNRIEPARFYDFTNRFNQFSISVRFSRLIFYRFSRFFWLIGFFEHPWCSFSNENWRRDAKKGERAKNCTNIYTDISYYGKLKEPT
jgi:hypothetical protein